MPDVFDRDYAQRSNINPSPSLTEQTPGLDRTQPIRSLALRTSAFVREKPRTALSILGGLVVLGVGAILASRRMNARRQIKLREVKRLRFFERLLPLEWVRRRVG